jgi:hypothetical protein
MEQQYGPGSSILACSLTPKLYLHNRIALQIAALLTAGEKQQCRRASEKTAPLRKRACEELLCCREEQVKNCCIVQASK